MKFVLRACSEGNRLIPDVVRLRGEHVSISVKLELGYTAVESVRNFQFEKAIPGTNEIMRTELMAPGVRKTRPDWRLEK